MQVRDSHVGFSMGMKNAMPPDQLESTLQAGNQEDRFPAYVFARSARYTLLGSPNPACKAIDPALDTFAVPAVQIPNATLARFAAAL